MHSRVPFPYMSRNALKREVLEQIFIEYNRNGDVRYEFRKIT